jgi:GR25 family glycosyltransferase involved in LPS biosynthesis
VDTWEEQIAKHAPTLNYVCLKGSSGEKRAALDTLDSGLVVVTFQGLSWMVSKLMKRDGRKRRRLTPTPDELLKLAASFDALVIDEATWLSNQRSLWFRVCNAVAKHTRYRYAMAGRLFSRDPQKMWPQFFLIDRGASLGETLGLFRQAFYDQKAGYWSMFVYTFKRGMAKKLTELVGHRSLTYAADECIDLPQAIYVAKPLTFEQETEAYYRRTVKELIKARGNVKVIRHSFIRMRQIASGFVGVTDDETGERAEIEFQHNPKLAMLLQVIDELPEGAKLVIVHEFIWTGKRICAELTKHKIKHVAMSGQVENRSAAKRRFLSEADCHLVLSHKVGAFGIDGLQDASHHMYIFESPVDAIAREQLERRLRRQGQRHKVIYIDALLKGSVDERIRAFHRSGDDLHRALIRDPARVLGGRNR